MLLDPACGTGGFLTRSIRHMRDPYTVADNHGDPVELLEKLDRAEYQAAMLRDELKSILAEALLR
jgi:type I restriction enzyme M protein